MLGTGPGKTIPWGWLMTAGEANLGKLPNDNGGGSAPRGHRFRGVARAPCLPLAQRPLRGGHRIRTPRVDRNRGTERAGERLEARLGDVVAVDTV